MVPIIHQLNTRRSDRQVRFREQARRRDRGAVQVDSHEETPGGLESGWKGGTQESRQSGGNREVYTGRRGRQLDAPEGGECWDLKQRQE